LTRCAKQPESTVLYLVTVSYITWHELRPFRDLNTNIQGCISSRVCPEVLHHVEMEMRGIQVNVDGYTKLNMTLTVHHCAKIHQ